MPDYCVCHNFTDVPGSPLWMAHFAKCPDVAPWIRAWAQRRIDGPGPAVVQPHTPEPQLRYSDL